MRILYRCVGGSIILVLLIQAASCYTYQETLVKESEDVECLIVATTGQRCLRLSAWSVDSLGSITGLGAEYLSLEAAKDDLDGRPFRGTIPADGIASIEAYRLDAGATTFVVVIAGAMVGFTVLVSGRD